MNYYYTILTSLFELDENLRNAVTVFDGTSVGSKVRGDGLLDDQGAANPVLDRGVNDAVMRIG